MEQHDKTTSMYMQYYVSKSSCLSSLIKVKLLHTLFGGYLNHVRQALHALPKIKHVYYNECKGQHKLNF